MVLGLTAGDAPAAVSPGDRVAKATALSAIAKARASQNGALAAYRAAAGTRRFVVLTRRLTIYRTTLGAQRARIVATRPTSREGQSVRAIGLRVMALFTTHRALLVQRGQALRTRNAARARALGTRLDSTNLEIARRIAQLRAIALPDAALPVLEVHGFFGAPTLPDFPAAAPTGLTPVDGVVVGCKPTDTTLGFYYTPRHVAAAITARVEYTHPDGSGVQSAALSPSSVAKLHRARRSDATPLPNGAYRWVFKLPNGRVFLDVAVRRFCI
jgi:hypothetical protein